MKKKYLKNGIATFCTGVLLCLLSVYSPTLLMQADATTSVMSQGLEAAKFALVGGVILIFLSCCMFILATVRSQ